MPVHTTINEHESDFLGTDKCKYAIEESHHDKNKNSMYEPHLDLLYELRGIVGRALELTSEQISSMNFNILDLYSDVIVCRFFAGLKVAIDIPDDVLYKIEQVNKYGQVLKFSDKSRSLWLTKELAQPINQMKELAAAFSA